LSKFENSSVYKTALAQENKYEERIKQMESELKILKEEKETQELEIRHLRLVNDSMHNSNSQRSGVALS
jgi:hypothetical protein